jgi:hypothetical protein
LVEKLGGDQVFVYGGDRFGVVRFARLLLDRLRTPPIPVYWRRKFEASTGINCSAFYENRTFRPLTAASIIEAFLDSPGAADYEDGARYFFGHRIPDRA